MFFVGCNHGNQYNIGAYDSAIKWMTLDYIAENTTRNSTISKSESAPETITYMITIQSEFKALTEFLPGVDFEKGITILYMFTDIYNGYKCPIEKVTFTDGVLELIFLHKMPKKGILGVRLPSIFASTQRCIVQKWTK